MYSYIICLKGTNKKLATLELENLWNLYFKEKIILKQEKNTIFSFTSRNLLKKTHPLLSRLCLTNWISLLLWKGKELSKLEESLKLSNIDKTINSFAIESYSLNKNESKSIENKNLAKPIWNILTKPKVNMKNPEERFNFFFKDKIIMCSIEIFLNIKNYLTRMPKYRPIARPYTLKSDMARVGINLLTCVNENELIFDPFCGIGGILLEAKDMKFKILGNDISFEDLELMRENFNFYFPKEDFYLIQSDSTTRVLKENSIDGLVTDIPYGRCSRKLGVDLYKKFLKNAKIYLKPNKRLVIVYANFVEFKDIATKYFNEVDEITQYINKSMTRHILILENKK